VAGEEPALWRGDQPESTFEPGDEFFDQCGRPRSEIVAIDKPVMAKAIVRIQHDPDRLRKHRTHRGIVQHASESSGISVVATESWDDVNHGPESARGVNVEIRRREGHAGAMKHWSFECFGQDRTLNLDPLEVVPLGERVLRKHRVDREVESLGDAGSEDDFCRR
jgi:hypothetical protein